MTTEERLANVERELGRAKRRNRWLLAGLGLCLGALVVVWVTQGRYAISSTLGERAFVLDTRTGQLWIRTSERGSYYLGTNDNPKEERKETP